MKFDWLLFDLDETIMNFKSAADQALRDSFTKYDIPENKHTIETYHAVNSQVWREFEEGKISVEILIASRMERFLEALTLDHVAPDALNDYYLDRLARHSTYFPDAEPVLDQLVDKDIKMAIVTNGLTRVQKYRWENSSLPKYFQHLFISQEIGRPKPHNYFFEYVHGAIKRPDRNKVLVIGDNPASDIKGARDFGYKSCWINRDDSIKDYPKSDYKIRSLTELLELI